MRGTALIGCNVQTGERLADVLISDDFARRIESGAAAIDRSRALGIPGETLMAHVLNAHGLAQMLRQNGGVRRRVALIVAAIGAGAEHPDRADVLRRQA